MRVDHFGHVEERFETRDLAIHHLWQDGGLGVGIIPRLSEGADLRLLALGGLLLWLGVVVLRNRQLAEISLRLT